MRTREQLTEKIVDGSEEMKKALGDLEREVRGTGPSFRVFFTYLFKIFAVLDMQLRLALLRHLTARSLSQFGRDSGRLAAIVFEYVSCILILAITAVIYLLTLVIVRPLEFLLDLLKK